MKAPDRTYKWGKKNIDELTDDELNNAIQKTKDMAALALAKKTSYVENKITKRPPDNVNPNFIGLQNQLNNEFKKRKGIL